VYFDQLFFNGVLKMKKRNVFVQTAVASALLALSVSALAGSLTATKRTVANEAFGSAFTATTKVFVPDVAYVFNTPAGIVVNDGGSIDVVFTMTGGQWSSSAALGAGNAVASAMGGVFAVTAPVASTVTNTNDTLKVTLTNSTGANITIGIGGTLTLTSLAGGVRFQAIGVTQDTPVTVSATVLNGTNVLESASDVTVVENAAAIASTFTASTETKQIDLTAAPAGSALTAGVAGTGLVQLGKIKFTATTGTKVDLDVSAGLVESTIAPGAPAFGTGLTVTVVPATGSFTAKQGIVLATAANCSGALTGGATTQTLAPLATAVTGSTTSIVDTVVSASAANLATDLVAGLYLCSDYSGKTASSVISLFKPTVTASYTKASTAYTGSTLAASTGYDLTNNGQIVDVLNYIPAAVTGYIQTVRLINTGTVDAQASVAVINEATGVVGTAAPIGAVIPAGGSLRLSQAAIEAVIGTQAATVRPRLRFSAATNSLKVQSLFNNANGAYTNLSGIEQ
jgi:hypothetical protein